MRLTLSNLGWLILIVSAWCGCIAPRANPSPIASASRGKDPLGKSFQEASLEPITRRESPSENQPAASAEVQASAAEPLPEEAPPGVNAEYYAQMRKLLDEVEEERRPYLEQALRVALDRAKQTTGESKPAELPDEPQNPNPTSNSPLEMPDAKPAPAKDPPKDPQPVAPAQPSPSDEPQDPTPTKNAGAAVAPANPVTQTVAKTAASEKDETAARETPPPATADRDVLAQAIGNGAVSKGEITALPAVSEDAPALQSARLPFANDVAQASFQLPANGELPDDPSLTYPDTAYPNTSDPNAAYRQPSYPTTRGAEQLPTNSLASIGQHSPAAVNPAASAAAQPLPPRAAGEDWKASLSRSVSQLQLELQDRTLDNETRQRLEAQLRIVHLLAGHREEAFQPISDLAPNLQQFWTEQLYGIDALLHSQTSPVPDHRAMHALRHLRTAIDHLAETSSLEVRNLSFCTRVDSYGQYQRFEKYEFQANQEVLLYAEVDNFAAVQEQLGAGYETALQGSYQIYDANGRRMADHQFSVDREKCANRRRDFFIPYHVYMPANIPHGRYTLKLTMEDKQANKFGQSAVSFTIVQ